MNFIWDIALRAKDSGIGEEQLFFRQAKFYSPYYEQSFPILNQDIIEEACIEVNALFRFSKLFQELLREEVTDFPEFQEHLFDCAMHVLLYCDLRYGISRRELFIRKFMNEIKEGCYGKEAATQFHFIEPLQQNRLATLVFTQMQTGSSLVVFRKAVLVLHGRAMLYQVKAQKQKLLLYVEEKITEERNHSLAFVIGMFLPLSYQVRVFWGYHFGVIGVDETMRLDEIEIY